MAGLIKSGHSPRVSFVVPNIGGASLGFATAFARALADDYEVQVVGPDFWGRGVMEIYRGCFDYTVVPAPHLYRFPDFLWESRRLGRAATGNVLFAVKATPQTVWVALNEKRRRSCKVVVCLDEWDGALMARRSPADQRQVWRRHWIHPLEENYYPIVEKSLSQADMVISTSTFLQRRFGGALVRMGVDTERFKPLNADEKLAVRAELGLQPGLRVIVFGGVVRPHKGVELIVEAMRLANDPNLRLLIIGPITAHLTELLKGPMGPYILAAGAKPAMEMPRWLGAGDLTILPMRDDLLAQSQVPCKVFEAMAIGLPVLAGAVSDLPEIVTGAGEVFPAGDVGALAEILKRWRMQPARVNDYSREARQRCLASYSSGVMRQELIRVLEGIMEEPQEGSQPH